jgi:hypothetical protein
VRAQFVVTGHRDLTPQVGDVATGRTDAATMSLDPGVNIYAE